jgi:hypothetical protein
MVRILDCGQNCPPKPGTKKLLDTSKNWEKHPEFKNV